MHKAKDVSYNIAECILCYGGLSMRESPPTWRSDLYGILPHPSEPGS